MTPPPDLATDPLQDLPRPQPGQVWLVGAGPGDPGLLTRLAVQALIHADVVLYDALVDPRVVALIPANAESRCIGKRGGQPSMRQADINSLLVERARAGQRVVRLKGGDPFLFGRGPEEGMVLAEAGIPFRVVPGVPAGIGGLAYAGIPVTSRKSSAVAFITGHDARGELPDMVDFAALARAVPVLVVYMPMGHLGELADRLLAAGRPETEPVALVSSASMRDQRVVTSTLGACVADAATAGIGSPALLVVGEVVDLRAALDWFDGA